MSSQCTLRSVHNLTQVFTPDALPDATLPLHLSLGPTLHPVAEVRALIEDQTLALHMAVVSPWKKAMYPCRAALQRFSSLSRHSMTHRVILHRDVVPRRLMSSVPGGTGENVMLVLLCGGAFAAAVTYAYRTVCRDSARFTERITEIAARPKNEGKTKPWPPKNAEEVSAVAAPPEAKVEEAAPAPAELTAEVNRAEPASMVETVAEVVAEAAEAVAEVAVIVEETAKEVAAVAHEVEKVAEDVEAAAKELETPELPVVEETAAEKNGTEAASQEEAKPEA